MQLRVYLFPVVVLFVLFALGVALYSSDASLRRLQRHICPELPLSNTRSVLRTFRTLRLLEEDRVSLNGTSGLLLLPQNGGFLKVRMSDDPEAVTDYGISMFHQLHCLMALRDVVFSSNLSSQTGHHHHAQDELVHWTHCFDYLAQGIICAADDTLEPPKIMLNEQGEKVHFVDGVGHITHQCHDPAPLWHAVRESNTCPYDEGVVHHSLGASYLPTGTEYHEDIPEVYTAE